MNLIYFSFNQQNGMTVGSHGTKRSGRYHLAYDYLYDGSKTMMIGGKLKDPYNLHRYVVVGDSIISVQCFDEKKTAKESFTVARFLKGPSSHYILCMLKLTFCAKPRLDCSVFNCENNQLDE